MTKKNKIKIIVNGKQTTINSNFSLKNLVDKLQIPLNKIAVEYNKQIIDKKKLKKVILSKNDRVEIVHFIGGG
ncbi:MAG: sulfur carrier protein ThiS [Candidatus Pelagibacter sp.]|jgi:thiamine biosynthesis protein ThiS|tara:strand:- start:2030 stop:2248 length:219 start_codon:yes stop_codon:yes gene_type:complete